VNFQYLSLSPRPLLVRRVVPSGTYAIWWVFHIISEMRIRQYHYNPNSCPPRAGLILTNVGFADDCHSIVNTTISMTYGFGTSLA